MFKQERDRGVYDVDPHTPALITAHGPGYIDREMELIVGLQTDAPLKRAIMPFGGWRVVQTSLQTYGYERRSSGRGDLHQVSQDAQRRRLRRLHRRDPRDPPLPRDHRTARLLRTRSDHR